MSNHGNDDKQHDQHKHDQHKHEPANLSAKQSTGGAGSAGKAGGSNGITWYNTMQALFAPYVPCMNGVPNPIDLSSYQDVVANITDIQSEIDSGGMPRGASYKAQWAKDNGKALFDQWFAANYPEGTPPGK